MTTIREMLVTSVGEPYSVKIERGMKGSFSYEISVKSEYIQAAISDLKLLKKEIEEVIEYGNPQM